MNTTATPNRAAQLLNLIETKKAGANQTARAYQYARKLKISAVAEESEFKQQQIKVAADAADYARGFFHADIDLYESCFLLMLNQSNTVTAWAKISQGGVVCTIVDPKIVCKIAIDSLASALILIHNHPSGNLSPSASDIKLTKNLAQVLKMLDIKLLDHIILTSSGYFSMEAEGML